MAPLRLPPLDIECDHEGGTEYWCKACAHIAAPLLQKKIESLESEIESLESEIATLTTRVTALRRANETFAREEKQRRSKG